MSTKILVQGEPCDYAPKLSWYTPGLPVYQNGKQVGHVTSARIAEDNKIIATALVDESFTGTHWYLASTDHTAKTMCLQASDGGTDERWQITKVTNNV